MKRLALAVAYLLSLAFVVSAARAGEPLSERLVPDPDLGPDAVVRIQLDALRANDAADGGIAVAFRFASPGNRASTGPLPRFARMIKQGPYALMLGFELARYEPVEIVGNRARQRVTLIGQAETVRYEFILSLQPAPECEAACWMTDAVLLVPLDGQSA